MQAPFSLGKRPPEPASICSAVLYKIAHEKIRDCIKDYQSDLQRKTQKSAIQSLLPLSNSQASSTLEGNRFRIRGFDDWYKVAGALSIYYKKQELIYPCQVTLGSASNSSDSSVKIVESKNRNQNNQEKGDAFVVFPDGKGAYIDFKQRIANFVSDPSILDQLHLLISIMFDKAGEKIRANPNQTGELFPTEPIFSAIRELKEDVDANIDPHELDVILAKAFLHRIVDDKILSKSGMRAAHLYDAEIQNYLDTLLVLMLGVEGSRNNLTYLSLLMHLDLIAAQYISSETDYPYNFRDFFASDCGGYWENIVRQDSGHQNFSGEFPMSATATGPGNFKDLMPYLYPQGKKFDPKEFVKVVSESPQKYRVTAQEMKIIGDWFKAKDPALYKEIINTANPLSSIPLIGRIKEHFSTRLALAYDPPNNNSSRLSDHEQFLEPNPIHLYRPEHSYSIEVHALRTHAFVHYYIEENRALFEKFYFHDSSRLNPCGAFNERFPKVGKRVPLSVKSVVKKVTGLSECLNSTNGEVGHNRQDFAQEKLPMAPLYDKQKKMIQQLPSLNDLEVEILRELAQAELSYFSEADKKKIINYMEENHLWEGYTKSQIKKMVNLIKVTLDYSQNPMQASSVYSIDENSAEYEALYDDLKLTDVKFKNLKERVMKALLLTIDQCGSFRTVESIPVQVNELMDSMEKHKWGIIGNLGYIDRVFNDVFSKQFDSFQIERMLSRVASLWTMAIDRKMEPTPDLIFSETTLLDLSKELKISQEKVKSLSEWIMRAIFFQAKRGSLASTKNFFSLSDDEKKDLIASILIRNMNLATTQDLLRAKEKQYTENLISNLKKFINNRGSQSNFTEAQIGQMIAFLSSTPDVDSKFDIDLHSQTYKNLNESGELSAPACEELKELVLMHTREYPTVYSYFINKNFFHNEVAKDFIEDFRFSLSPDFRAVIKADGDQGISLDPCPKCYRHPKVPQRRHITLSVNNEKVKNLQHSTKHKRKYENSSSSSLTSNMTDQTQSEEKSMDTTSSSQQLTNQELSDLKRFKTGNSNSNISMPNTTQESSHSSSSPVFYPSLQISNGTASHLNTGSSTFILPPPRNDGINVGLENYGNTCWLNAALKFISCHSYFDEMLTKQVSQEKKNIQRPLKIIVMLLRHGKSCDKFLIHNLGQAIEKFCPDFKWGAGLEHDCPEFLIQITRILEWTPTLKLTSAEQNTINASRRYPRQVRFYEPEPNSNIPEGWGKSPSHENFKPYIELTLSDYLNELDLSVLLQESESRKLKADIFASDDAQTEGQRNKNFTFTTKMYFTCLPDSFIVYLKRFQLSEKEKYDETSPLIISTPIKTDTPIVLREYSIQQDDASQREIPLPERSRSYQIGAAIIHSGNSSGKGGHYTMHERAKNGSLFMHNDNYVTRMSESNFGVQGYLIRLDAISKDEESKVNDP